MRFTSTTTLTAIALAVAGFSGMGWAQQSTADKKMSFFITSAGPGKGADLGGLAGADKHCQDLAKAVGAGNRTWRAYLSTVQSGGKKAVNARDRIGKGPWYNAKGELIARDVDFLHSDQANLTKQTALNEKGQGVNGSGDKPTMHDILTGSDSQGRAFQVVEDTTCGNWTKNTAEGSANLGHHDRTGFGPGLSGQSWNHTHASRGCNPEGLRRTGGNGLFYCFAAK